MFIQVKYFRKINILVFLTLILVQSFNFGSLLEKYLSNSGMPSYEILSVSNSPVGGKWILMNVQSQTWRGIAWNHKVAVYIPRRLPYKERGIIFVTGSAPRDPLSKVNEYTLVAESIGAPFAILWDIPNQPLFGLREDALIAFTFAKYLETREEDWPLLFPMVKSVVATMDCLQQLFKDQGLNVEKFLITGASKRGWTTYLTGAVDKRVFAIVPIVYDNLNLQEQMKKQLEYYGTFSEQIKDYTRLGLTELMVKNDEKISELVKSIDPYYYDIKAAKLIILGSNDPYWVVDSSEIYFDKLTAPKYLMVMPNEGHDISNTIEIFNSIRAFFTLAVNEKYPNLHWKNEESSIVLDTEEEIEYAKGWYATSNSLDFRKSYWQSVELEVQNDGQKSIVEFNAPATQGNVAMFIEVRVVKEGYTLSLTTTPRVFRK
ncbi:PhoPQ-activated protein PqaA family protein [Fervidobacterium gondwanense]|uniref:PhoPQ-activated protein PqaA family protein n=1 Tax=Fervidobacterium gondwanense TaxID=44754 RepID=UPI003C73BA9B